MKKEAKALFQYSDLAEALENGDFFHLLRLSILRDIGAGDVKKGSLLFFCLAWRLDNARKKHRVFAQGKEEALEVIREEFLEFEQAIKMESGQRQVGEALDVMATCARFILGEHE